ncbi:CHASE2 domain-containing protein [Rhodopseudomonas sp. NSM]|uniref:CHASE2 domain-containing protein n=1 Tax=Rhodopseudomonas sp. NSM TaxID=3457630 RepID=UPI0040373EAC
MRIKRRALLPGVALLIAGLWGGALGYRQLDGDIAVLERFEATMSDLRALLRGQRVAPDLVTIIVVDDETVRRTGHYPLRRGDLAMLIARIAADRPKAIALDLLLLEQTTPEADAAVASALAQRPTALAAAAVFADAQQTVSAGDGGPLSRLPTAARFLMPLPEFAARAAIGVVNVATDQSGTPRAFPMLFRSDRQIEMSLPLRTVALAVGVDPSIEYQGIRIGDRLIPTDIDHRLPIAFYGRRGTIRTISAADDPLPHDAIADRIVVVGATVTGGSDFFPTPFDPVMPGVEVVATAVNHLISGDGMLRDYRVRRADAIIAATLPMLLIALLAWRRNAVGLIAIAIVLALALGANVLAYGNGILLSASLPLAAAAPPALLFGAVQLWADRRRAQHFASTAALFQQFQAPAMRQWLSRDPAFLLDPVRQDASIVFIDLSGFTALSETLSAQAVRELLKDFHALMDSEATTHGGIVTSFLGDGAMIVFGLPEPSAVDSRNAASCCASLSRRTWMWLAKLPTAIAAQLRFKIGAHCGEIVASRLGGDGHQHITATGDTVNVASRLMEVAARYGAELALSDEMLRAAGSDCMLSRTGELVGPQHEPIRGRARSLAVWLWYDRPAVAAVPVPGSGHAL